MSTNRTAVCWPALIVFDGEDEITVVRSADYWWGDPDLSCWAYDPADAMVDSEGVEHRLVDVTGRSNGQGDVVPVPTGDHWTLHRVKEALGRDRTAVGRTDEIAAIDDASTIAACVALFVVLDSNA